MSLHFAVDNTLGAAFVGFSVSCVCYGISSSQTYTYFQRYPSDKAVYKLLVAAIWILETIDQIFIGHAVYYYTITNYDTPLALLTGKVTWTLILQMTLGAINGTIVKSCFALRVWRFSDRNLYITGVIFLLAFGQLGLAILYTIKCFQSPYFVTLPKLKLTGTLPLAMGVCTDVIIAGSLCFFLQKLRTGYSKSDSLVNSLTRYAVNTGILTSALSLSTLIMYNLMPDNFIFVGLYFILSKLYAISFLATLNTRKTIRGRGTDRQGGTSTGLTFHMIARTTRPLQDQSFCSKSQVEIGVHQEVSVVSDMQHEPRKFEEW